MTEAPAIELKRFESIMEHSPLDIVPSQFFCTELQAYAKSVCDDYLQSFVANTRNEEHFDNWWTNVEMKQCEDSLHLDKNCNYVRLYFSECDKGNKTTTDILDEYYGTEIKFCDAMYCDYRDQGWDEPLRTNRLLCRNSEKELCRFCDRCYDEILLGVLDNISDIALEMLKRGKYLQ